MAHARCKDREGLGGEVRMLSVEKFLSTVQFLRSQMESRVSVRQFFCILEVAYSSLLTGQSSNGREPLTEHATKDIIEQVLGDIP